MQQPGRYRQPWAPAVPSTLGMTRSGTNPMAQTGMPGAMKAEHDGASDQGVEAKTNPATPVKIEEASTSPSRGSARDE